MELDKVIDLIKRGNTDTYALVVEEYQLGVQAYVAAFCPDRAVAREISREAFIQVLVRLERFEKGADLYGWLKDHATRRLKRALEDLKQSEDPMKAILANDAACRLSTAESRMIGDPYNALCMAFNRTADFSQWLLKTLYDGSIDGLAARARKREDELRSELYTLWRRLGREAGTIYPPLASESQDTQARKLSRDLEYMLCEYATNTLKKHQRAALTQYMSDDICLREVFCQVAASNRMLRLILGPDQTEAFCDHVMSEIRERGAKGTLVPTTSRGKRKELSTKTRPIPKVKRNHTDEQPMKRKRTQANQPVFVPPPSRSNSMLWLLLGSIIVVSLLCAIGIILALISVQKRDQVPSPQAAQPIVKPSTAVPPAGKPNASDAPAPRARPMAPKIYEAEDAEIVGCEIKSGGRGYSGTGYVDYTHASNDSITWTVNIESARVCTLEFRYALSEGNRPLRIKVNGKPVKSLDFPATGSWQKWQVVSVEAPLKAGNNSVSAIATGSSGGNIDSLTVK